MKRILSIAALALSAISSCSDAHTAGGLTRDRDAGASGDATRADAGSHENLDDAAVLDTPVIDAAADCGEAGAPLSRPERFALRERVCLHSGALVDMDGRAHRPHDGGTADELTACPLPDELAWPGGGETCWWEPLCNTVEARVSDGGVSLECCYDVQRMCGV